MRTLSEAVALGCSLARDYYGKGMSPVALLDASGYRVWRYLVSVGRIREYLAEHPDLVRDWAMYSENKRVSSGWYFDAESKTGPFVVGFYPGDKKQEFGDEFDACAEFVKHELDSIAR